MSNNLKHQDILLQKAKEDLDAARSLIKEKSFSEEIVLFHCQQTIEKLLKAYLHSQGIIYPKTHDIEVLLSVCLENDISFNQVNFVTSLTPYAVEIRYDEFVELPQEEVTDILKQTEEAYNFLLRKIKI